MSESSGSGATSTAGSSGDGTTTGIIAFVIFYFNLHVYISRPLLSSDYFVDDEDTTEQSGSGDTTDQSGDTTTQSGESPCTASTDCNGSGWDSFCNFEYSVSGSCVSCTDITASGGSCQNLATQPGITECQNTCEGMGQNNY